MKLRNLKFIFLLVAANSFGSSHPASATKDVPARTIDSGSFGIFVNGKRVATESFRVEQQADSSVATAEIKAVEGGPTQRAEMHLAPNGDLQHYRWEEGAAPKSEVVVEASDQLLVEHVTAPSEKTRDVSHMLPLSTMILDDNFFSQREILAWRFMSIACAPAGGVLKCNNGKAQFPILIPRQHISSMVSLQFAGQEKFKLHGVDHILTGCKMQTDGPDWMLWFDENKKMVRIVIASDNTEIIRD